MKFNDGLAAWALRFIGTIVPETGRTYAQTWLKLTPSLAFRTGLWKAETLTRFRFCIQRGTPGWLS